MLAFVRPDAIFTLNNEPRNKNFDYFTLIKEDGNWKILNDSYVLVQIKNISIKKTQRPITGISHILRDTAHIQDLCTSNGKRNSN